MKPDAQLRLALARVAAEHGTPAYAYRVDELQRRIATLRQVFSDRFGVSFAVKSNPNAALLRRLRGQVDTLDCSSIGEVEQAVVQGWPAADLTFSGPAKRPFELRRAVELGVGEMVAESVAELDQLDALCREAERSCTIFLRINPSRAPRKFGVRMSGKPSQFGIDEEAVDPVLSGLRNGRWPFLRLEGLHIYSGTNSLDAEAIAENFAIFGQIFAHCAGVAGIRPRKLIFGSGFGIPYVGTAEALDINDVAERVNPWFDAWRAEHELLADARCMLELGRWLIGPCGYFLTSVIGCKHSRGTEIRLCDGGMNNHLAACGLLGMVIRRPYPMWKITPGDEPVGPKRLVGPLCTTIDTLAEKVELPPLAVGDVIAVGSSGAYGLSSSPTRFISHPPPKELLIEGSGHAARIIDVTEGGMA